MALLNVELGLIAQLQLNQLLSQSVVDCLEAICFSNWAVELDGDESEDVAVIVVYNVAVMSVQHVLVWRYSLTAGNWSNSRPPGVKHALDSARWQLQPTTANNYRYLSNRLITASVRTSFGAGLSAALCPSNISQVICGRCALAASNGLYSFVLQMPADNDETNK